MSGLIGSQRDDAYYEDAVMPHVRLPKELWERLKRQAIDASRSVNSIIVEACGKWLELEELIPTCPHCGEPLESKLRGWWCQCHPEVYWNKAGSWGDMMP